MKNIRAGFRAAAFLATVPLLLGLVAVQRFVVGPLTDNQTVIPGLIYKTLRPFLGLKVEFNAASAPIVKDKPVWYLANHLANADAFVLGGKFDGTFVGKGDVLQWPGISQIIRAVRFIGLRRSSEFNGQSRAKIIRNFNDGYNTIMFPEGTTGDGKKLWLFRAGLLTLLFGEKGVDKNNNEVTLEKDVVVQAVAMRVKSANGQDAADNAEARDLYCMFSEFNLLREAWKRMQIQSVTIEITAFPPLDPRDFKDARELANTVALKIASVVNPGQTVFEKARFPGVPFKPSTTTA